MPRDAPFLVNGAGGDITLTFRRISRHDLQNRVFLADQGSFWVAKQLCLAIRKPYGNTFTFNRNEQTPP